MILLIDERLENYLPRRTDDEVAKLRELIVRDGEIRDPIVVGLLPDGSEVILDGHTRYRIYRETPNLPEPPVTRILIESIDAAKAWMRETQLARRNMTPDQLLMFCVSNGLPPPATEPAYRIGFAGELLMKAPNLAALVRQGGGKTLRGCWNEYLRSIGKTKPRGKRAPANDAPPPSASSTDLYRTKQQLAEAAKREKTLLADKVRLEDELGLKRLLDAREPVVVPPPPKVPGSKRRRGVPVMLCSDWHVEEKVDPAKVNGLNEYNLDIAERRIAALPDAWDWMLRDSRYDCREGLIWLGGDLITGHIHDELVESTQLSPGNAIKWLGDRLEVFFRRIAQTSNLEKIIVVCNSGNHGRTTDRIRVSTREDHSFESLMYAHLAARLRDEPRFDFRVAAGEYEYVDLMGFHMAFSHGDQFKYQGGIGGVSIPIRRKLASIKQYRPLHHLCIGHFHQRQDFGDCSINGSLIGMSPYAQNIGAAPEPPQQSWFMVDAERGKCLSAPIWVEELAK